MSLIFDSFKTQQDARRFMGRVRELHPDRDCQLFLNEAAALEADPFPSQLYPPIVHVGRRLLGVCKRFLDLNAEDEGKIALFVAEEEEVQALVGDFGGEYVGT